LERLDEVAAHHGGLVPLHGRLFAQWMHYAYPRECPYPHVSGTTSPFRFSIIADAGEDDLFVTDEELQHFMSESSSRRGRSVVKAAAEEQTMWTMEEELVVCRAANPETSDLGRFRDLVFIAGMAMVSAGFARGLSPWASKSVVGAGDRYRHYV
jgi:hypothetical protein